MGRLNPLVRWLPKLTGKPALRCLMRAARPCHVACVDGVSHLALVPAVAAMITMAAVSAMAGAVPAAEHEVESDRDRRIGVIRLRRIHRW